MSNQKVAEANIHVHHYGLTLERAQKLQVELKKLMGRGAEIEVDTDEPPILEKEQDRLSDAEGSLCDLVNDFDPDYGWETLGEANREIKSIKAFIPKVYKALDKLMEAANAASVASEKLATEKRNS